MKPRYPQTAALVPVIRTEMDRAGFANVSILMKPSASDDVDDEIGFAWPDGTRSAFHIQSGPQGAAINETVETPDGTCAVENGATRSMRMARLVGFDLSRRLEIEATRRATAGLAPPMRMAAQ
jgi:hypothetical protein